MSDILKDYDCSKMDLQRSQWCIVIGKDYIKNDFEKSIEKLSLRGFTYYAILHDKDVNAIGEFKYPHYHIVLTTAKRPKAKTVMNLLTEIFDTSIDNISITECFDLTLSIQYLIHKNDIFKYQYKVDNVLTNDVFNDINDIMKTKMCKIIPSTDSFISLIIKSKDRLELIQTLGVSMYAYYRNTINDIIKTCGRYDLLDNSYTLRDTHA